MCLKQSSSLDLTQDREINREMPLLQPVGTHQYQATLAPPKGEYLGFLVEVVDRDPETMAGLITSGFKELKPRR